MAKRHANEFLRTGSGRLAGNGIIYDRYDEESGYRNQPSEGTPKHSKKWIEERKKLKEPQPIKYYKMTKGDLKKYE